MVFIRNLVGGLLAELEDDIDHDRFKRLLHYSRRLASFQNRAKLVSCPSTVHMQLVRTGAVVFDNGAPSLWRLRSRARHKEDLSTASGSGTCFGPLRLHPGQSTGAAARQFRAVMTG